MIRGETRLAPAGNPRALVAWSRRLTALALAVAGLILLPPAGLAAAGEITGKVVDGVSKVAIERVEVCAIEVPEFEFVDCVETNPAGEYALSGLPADSYVVEFWAEDLGYAVQFYEDQVFFDLADPIVVPGSGTVTGIDGHLSKLPIVIPPPPPTPPAPIPSALPAPTPTSVVPKPAIRCRKGFKQVKRNGKKICVKKHRKKSRKKTQGN